MRKMTKRKLRAITRSRKRTTGIRFFTRRGYDYFRANRRRGLKGDSDGLGNLMITAIGSKCVIETARLVLVGEFDEEHTFAEADINTQSRSDKEAKFITLCVLGEGDEDVVSAVSSKIRGHLGFKEVHFDVREDRDSHCGFVVRVVLLVTDVFRFFEAHIDIIHTDTSAQTDDLVEAVGCNKVGSKREVLLVIDTFVERKTELGFKTLNFPFFLLREDGGTHEHKAQDKKQSFHSEKEIKLNT